MVDFYCALKRLVERSPTFTATRIDRRRSLPQRGARGCVGPSAPDVILQALNARGIVWNVWFLLIRSSWRASSSRSIRLPPRVATFLSVLKAAAQVVVRGAEFLIPPFERNCPRVIVLDCAEAASAFQRLHEAADMREQFLERRIGSVLDENLCEQLQSDSKLRRVIVRQQSPLAYCRQDLEQVVVIGGLENESFVDSRRDVALQPFDRDPVSVSHWRYSSTA